MYDPVDPKVSFPEQEEKILAFWEKNAIFKKSISNREGAPEYTFYDGPPFATGLPHFGHFVPSTIKDIIPRYQTMKGNKIERRFGWDCHGLPVENLIEKELGLNSKTDIENFGIAKFNEACRASVLRYVNEWRQTITRLGRWVDFENDYKTMDPDYMESIWWVMKSLWEKGLLYEGAYILPYCPRCSTVLSNHEVAQGGYKDVHDPAVTVKFKVRGTVSRSPADASVGAPVKGAGFPLADGNTFLLAWTTTPWTLPSNLGLTLGPDVDYVLVADGSERYILAEARLGAFYKDPASYTILWKKKGAELEGLTYEPLFPYFASLEKNEDGSPGAFRTFLGAFVTTEDGTGIVHTAPGFGEEDNKVFKGSGVPSICPIDAECKFTAEVPEYQGIFVKDADKAILDRLKAEGKLVKREQILHSYPHCWRCSSPLIYRAIGSWFVSVEKVKQNMLNANFKINWQPAHIKEGRFGKWLEGARDWAISRNRYWGNPIPVWKCPDCGKTICVGSREELKKLSGVYPEDLHKHFVDQITIPCECGSTMKRITEVLDCWFESGAMPYAQNHYPFENKEYFESHFPANFISEGLDQTRGWFYTLTVLAAALFDRPAFENCIVNGLVLATDGKKMSKSLRNYTDPNKVVNEFGADALRLFLMHSAVVEAGDLKYSDEGVRDVLKGILIPLWNSYSFYVTYANIDKIEPPADQSKSVFEASPNTLDRWILSITEKMLKEVSEALDAYDLSRAIDPIVSFVDQLNNWYIRRSRRRFWKSENDGDKAQAYATLYRALKKFALVAAPVIPFITESIWLNLRTEADSESVHLADYPVYDESLRDTALEFKMATVQKAVSMGRSLRYQYNLKTRQPLKAVELVTRNPEEKTVLLEMEESVREELNVKEVIFHDKEEDLVEYSAKANFRVLGKELGTSMKIAAAQIEKLTSVEIQSIIEGSILSIEVEGNHVELTAEKIIVNRIEKANLKVINEGTLTVGLDTEVTEELQLEGCIRDLVRGVQNLRKERGLDVTDRIALTVSSATPELLKKAFTRFKDYLMSETLSVTAVWTDSFAPGSSPVEIDAGEVNWTADLYVNKTVRSAALFASLLGVLASCKTAGPVPVSDPFAVLGSGASVYLVMPVEANRDLLDSFAGTQKESESLIRALERTDIVYSGIFPADSSGTASARLLAQGSFSPVTAPFLFPPSKGWTRKRVTDVGTWYHSERVDAAIPKSGLVFAASGSGIEAMLGNLKNPRPVPMAPAFVSYASNASSDGRIGLYVADAAVLTSLFMGPEVQFAVMYAEIYAHRLPEEGASAAGSMYEISARVVLSDARTARALSTLLRFAVSAGVSLEGDSVYLTGFQVTTERLVDLARSLYVISNEKNDEVLK